MIPRIEAVAALDNAVSPGAHKLHLCNKAVAVNDDGSLRMQWCVTREDGARMTDWMSYKGAKQQMGKMIAERESMV